jgi:hypothetical protein
LVVWFYGVLSKDEINKWKRERRGRDRMAVAFTTTYVISAFPFHLFGLVVWFYGV